MRTRTVTLLAQPITSESAEPPIECSALLTSYPSTLAFRMPGVDDMTFSGIDTWACFIELRLWLEAKGYLLLCAGARIDVTPSGLTRSMMLGEVVYITRIGEDSSLEDRVSIFAYAAPELVGTVAQQQEHKRNWCLSVGLTPPKDPAPPPETE